MPQSAELTIVDTYSVVQSPEYEACYTWGGGGSILTSFDEGGSYGSFRRLVSPTQTGHYVPGARGTGAVFAPAEVADVAHLTFDVQIRPRSDYKIQPDEPGGFMRDGEPLCIAELFGRTQDDYEFRAGALFNVPFNVFTTRTLEVDFAETAYDGRFASAASRGLTLVVECMSWCWDLSAVKVRGDFGFDTPPGEEWPEGAAPGHFVRPVPNPDALFDRVEVNFN